MTANLLRLAWASSWRGGSKSVARCLLLAISAAGAVVCLGMAVSAFQFSVRVADRHEPRAFAPAGEGQSVTMHRRTLFDATPQGDQIYVYWIALVDPAIQIPGLPRHVTEGKWFVSPELRRRMVGQPSLAERFPNASQIGESGVARPDELIAYRTVSEMTVSKADPSTTALSEQTTADNYLADPGDTAPRATAIAGLMITGLPALGLVLSGLAPSLHGARRRLRLLEALGAAPSTSRIVLAASTTLAAGPGIVLAGVGWWLASQQIEQIPLVNRRAFRGDFSPSLPLLVLVAVAVQAACIFGALSMRGEVTTMRPGQVTLKAPQAVRLAALGAGLALLLKGGGVMGAQNETLFIAGVIGTTIGAAFSLPVVLDRIGAAVARIGGLTPLLLGRRMVWNSRVASRTLIGLCSLCAVVPVASAWVGANRASAADELDLSDPQPVWVNGPLGRVDRDTVTAATGAAVLLLVDNEGASATDRPTSRLVTDCSSWPASQTDLGRCDGNWFELSPRASDAMRRFVPTTSGNITGLTSAADLEGPVVASIFLGPDWRAVDSVLRSLVVNASAPLPQVGYTMPTMSEGPSVRWVLAALFIGAITAIVGLCVRLAALALASADHRRRLVNLGMSELGVRANSAFETAAPILAAGGLAVGAGFIGAEMYRRIDPFAPSQHKLCAMIVALVAGVAILSAGVSWALAGGETERAE